jgi:hypothetical protein
MKKVLKLIMMLSLISIMCLIFASCNDEVPICETHTDEDKNLVCDVCNTELEPAGPTQVELEMADKEVVAKNINKFLSSGLTLINGERTLPNISAPIEVESNLLSTHWVSRLQGFYISDGKIKLTLANDNRAALAESKDVYIGIAPYGIYAIEDDTVSLDYTTHIYTAEQMRVVTPVLTREDITSNGDGTFGFKHETLVTMFSRVLLTETAQNITNDLYDRQLIVRLSEIMKSTSVIKIDENKEVVECQIHLYTEDNALKTDICTVNYSYTPAKQYFKISFNLNYIMDIEYSNLATSTYQVFNQFLVFHTEKPGDRNFRGTDVKLTSRYSKSNDAVITFPKDIQQKMAEVENSLVYTKEIQKKYSNIYNVINSDWNCGSVYVYDERYDAYILLASNEETSGRQVAFAGIEFDCDKSVHCVGTIDLMSRTVTIEEHSDEELMEQALSIKYTGKFTAATTECTNVAIYDSEYKMYVLFKRTPNGEGGLCYTFAGMSKTIDKSTICQAECILQNFVLVFTEHNTNHTSH